MLLKLTLLSKNLFSIYIRHQLRIYVWTVTMSSHFFIKSVSSICALSSLFFLSGCTNWVKPGAGPAELNAATTHCDAVSYATLPVNTVSDVQFGANYGDRDKCEKYSSNGCVKRDGRYYSIIHTSHDTNSYGRSAIFRDCMIQNGWHDE